MEEYLDQAEVLLRDVVQSRDISSLVVLHHLRDLAGLLDNLKLYDECLLTGNCALDLAEALGRRSLEFGQEHAETLALIAGLSVYEPRARTLFVQAVSICEEVVANDASHSNKVRFFDVLARAGYWAVDSLGVQWLERAIQVMTKELPPTVVPPDFRGLIYSTYGYGLVQLKQYANAIEAYHESISIHRILVDNNPAKYKYSLATTLMDMGATLNDLGKYDDAIAVLKEALGIFTAMSAPYPLQYNQVMADTLHNYGITLLNLNQFSEAATAQKQSISFRRNLAQTGNEGELQLCDVLYNYGHICYSLGKHAEVVLAFQECIPVLRARAATDPEYEVYLSVALHDVADSFNALGQCVEANAAAIEALEMNHGSVFKWCRYAPDFKLCFVCQSGKWGKILGLFRGNWTQ